MKSDLMKIRVWQQLTHVLKCLARTGIMKIRFSSKPILPVLHVLLAEHHWEIETVPPGEKSVKLNTSGVGACF